MTGALMSFKPSALSGTKLSGSSSGGANDAQRAIADNGEVINATGRFSK
jgi:hypothetical protein